MNNRKIKVGIVGLGTVGVSVLHLFYKNKEIISHKTGTEIEIISVSDINPRRKIFLPDKNIEFTTAYTDIIKNPEIDIVVELVGGTGVAYDIIVNSLKNKKHVVTANKAVLSENWDKIFNLSYKYKKFVYFESSVAAGIPIIQSLNEGLAANRISQIVGILNGTTNYILTTMLKYNRSFSAALSFAQKYGFAEKNYQKDIQGIDTAHKLSILSSIAYSRWIKLKDIYIEGIENIELQDLKFADEFGYRIKLLGNAEIVKDKFVLEVRKYLVKKNSVFANIDNEYNAILVKGDFCGSIIFTGKGAGGEPAASAVVADIIQLAKGIVNNTIGTTPYITYNPKLKTDVIPIKHTKGCFYIRFVTKDRPGVLAKIANVLGKHKVSIASVYQKEPLEKLRRGVPIIMLTHRVKEGNLIKSLEKIEHLDVILKKPVFIKIME